MHGPQNIYKKKKKKQFLKFLFYRLKDFFFTFFAPYIFDNQFTTLSQEKVQCYP